MERVESVIHPTEDPSKVKQVMENVFDGELSTLSMINTSILRGTARGMKSLQKIKDMIKRDRIRAAARRIMNESIVNNTLTFHINKQVALRKHVSFCSPDNESPLGPVSITIEGENLAEAVKWLTDE